MFHNYAKPALIFLFCILGEICVFETDKARWKLHVSGISLWTIWKNDSRSWRSQKVMNWLTAEIFFQTQSSLWGSGVLKYPKKCLEDLITFFMSTWWGDSKNMEEIEFSRWLFEGRLRQGKNMLPDGLNWLCYFAR